MSKYDVVIKSVKEVLVASLRDTVPLPSEQGSLWRELEGYLALNRVRPVGTCFTLYHDDEYQERDWDIEVCEPLPGDLDESTRVKVRTLPAVESMACTVHNGPFTTIGDAYNAVIKWINDNGYRIVGPGRELNLRPAKGGSQHDPKTVTEIQYPVEKI